MYQQGFQRFTRSRSAKLLSETPLTAEAVAMDRACEGDETRELVAKLGSSPEVPPKSSAPPRCEACRAPIVAASTPPEALVQRFPRAEGRWLRRIAQRRGLSLSTRSPLENAPALEVISRYDSARTLFYLNPPYVHRSRGDAAAYGHEMTDQDHCELAALLHDLKGRAVLSGYRSPLYDDLFSTWHRVDADAKLCNSSKGKRTESLWMNFEPALPPPSAKRH